MLHGEVTAVEVHPGRARARWPREMRAERARGHCRPARARRERLRPRARRRAVLGARRARAAPRPALARAAAARAAARAAAGGRRAHAARRHDRLRGLHAERRRERGGGRRRRARGRAARRGVAAVRASEAARVPAHAARTATGRAGFFIARLRSRRIGASCPGADWIRTVEVEPSLYAADFANLGAQIEALLRAGCRVFHFDVGDGHFVEPITMGPIVLQSISPLIHRHERRDRRAPDGRAAGEVLRAGRGRRWRQRHVPLRGGRRRRRRRSAPRASTGCRSASPSTRRPSRRTSRRSRATPTSCSAWRSIPATRASRSARRPTSACARLRARAAGRGAHPGRRRRRGRHDVEPLHERGRDAARRGARRSSRTTTSPAPTGGSSQALA